MGICILLGKDRLFSASYSECFKLWICGLSPDPSFSALLSGGNSSNDDDNKKDNDNRDDGMLTIKMTAKTVISNQTFKQ